MSDYSPTESNAWEPGAPGNTSAWQSLVDNDAILYASANTVHVAAYGPYTTTGATPFIACYFALPANYDELSWRLDYGYAQSGSSAKVKFVVTDGTSSDSATDNLTASSGSDFLEVAPSSTSASTTPRYGYVELTASAGQSLTVSFIYVTLLPAVARTGVLTSGYISVGAQWYATNAPIPSEIVETLQNNPHKIAKDRVQALHSTVQLSESADRGRFSTNATAFKTVSKALMPRLRQDRKYRLWTYVERSGTAKADVLVMIGALPVLLTDDEGIMQTTFEGGAFDLEAGGPGGNDVKLRVSSGSGYVALRTLQILEEPE